MKIVSKEEFWNYFQDKDYTIEQGMWMHSDNFIVDGEIVGYREANDFGGYYMYELKYGTVNTEAINLVGNIIKSKL